MAFDRRHFLGGAAALSLSGLLPGQTRAAQDWPNRLVRIVVPYPPGGSSDIIARQVAPHLSDLLKQNVVVDNKPGANSNLGTGIVAQTNDEGHTLLLCDVGALAISPSVYTKLSFDPSKDLRAVSMLAYSPHVLAVHPSFPAKTLPEIVELSKKQRVGFAVSAIGSAPHLAAVAVINETLATTGAALIVRHVRGHQSNSDGRQWVNNTVDKLARGHMRTARSSAGGARVN